MNEDHNTIPTDEYKALYSLYLSCLQARDRGERLPKRVSDDLPAVRAAYASQGADEYGTKKDATLAEQLNGE